MNERIRALLNAPGSVAPQTTLTTTREINAAIERNVNGKNYGVYCIYENVKHRVYRARTRSGRMEVRLQNNVWITPDHVYVEG
jgi:hypothetical protein